MDVLKIMIDAVRGNSMENYTKGQTSEAIRNALIEMNGGSNKINFKNFYKGSELFNLVQELLPVIIEEGFKDEDEIFKLVEYKNIAEGDEQEFIIEGNSLFAVADAANGIRGVRRQRIDNSQSLTIPTQIKVVRIYEELNRLLAGKVSFDKMVENVAKSFKQEILSSIHKVIGEISKDSIGLNDKYVFAGTMDEEKLLEVVGHVEAATGAQARIYGTKAALRKIKTAVVSDEAMSDMYNMGYYGRFNGVELISLRQSHVPGTDEFALDNNTLLILASNDQPVKVVNEGEGLLIERQPADNIDLTQEYIYGQGFGIGVVCANKMGKYVIG